MVEITRIAENRIFPRLLPAMISLFVVDGMGDATR
jgi:hypothetical protein